VGSTMSSWDGGRFIKEDGIFCFEGGFEVARVWMV
jgi:hypothetical protein